MRTSPPLGQGKFACFTPEVTGTPAIDRRSMGVLTAGHLFADVSQGAVPALLPFLVAERGYSYAAVSALVLAATLSSSIVQPLFGHLSDGRPAPWMMPAGVGLAGVGIAMAGLAPTYALTFVCVLLAGLGVAAFHPEASRHANYVSGERRATGMSFFAVGGNAGFALGPILVTPLVLVLGLSGTALLALPALVMAAVLMRDLPRLRSFRPSAAALRAARGGQVDRWAPFARLGMVVSLRSIAFFALVTFVPLYFVADLNTSEATANAALTTMLVCGAIGTLIGGRLADRVGRRAVLVTSLAVLGPAILVMLVSGPVLAFVMLALIGGVTVATFSVTVVMGQEYLPGRLGIASGVTLGLAIGVGGVVAAPLGLLADAVGIRTVLAGVAVLPLLALGLGLTLPGTGVRRAGEREDVGRTPVLGPTSA